jgi:hypothetical protein
MNPPFTTRAQPVNGTSVRLAYGAGVRAGDAVVDRRFCSRAITATPHCRPPGGRHALTVLGLVVRIATTRHEPHRRSMSTSIPRQQGKPDERHPREHMASMHTILLARC